MERRVCGLMLLHGAQRQFLQDVRRCVEGVLPRQRPALGLVKTTEVLSAHVLKEEWGVKV